MFHQGRVAIHLVSHRYRIRSAMSYKVPLIFRIGINTEPSYFLGQNTGEKVAQGHKASFCLEDTKCDPGFEQVWNCTDRGDQGVSPGCYDIYYWNIDCQWVDCTDFVHGAFYLRVHLNPGNQVAESDFKNNVAKCSVYDYGSYVITNRCWIGKFVNKLLLCD